MIKKVNKDYHSSKIFSLKPVKEEPQQFPKHDPFIPMSASELPDIT